MFHESATDLNSINADKFNEWLNSFDTVLADGDGKKNLFQK